MSESNFAFLFPGQGSQKIGMLQAAAEQFAAVRETFAEASDVLGYDMWQLIQQGEQEEINLTEKTQPILLTSSVALWRTVQSLTEFKPALLAGHSLGEFTALVCAGSLKFSDAVKLVESRGQFMQTAVPVGEGAMAAILGLEDDVINNICQEVSASSDGEVVVAVNYNSPGQVVIAGHTRAVETASKALTEAGAKRAMPLPVSAPFHTPLMKPAGEKLKEVLDTLELVQPQIPVVHNVHAQPETDPEKIKALLVEQIYSPVQWVACVEYLAKQGVNQVVECGPGKVLCGLVKRIDKAIQTTSIEEPQALQSLVEELTA